MAKTAIKYVSRVACALIAFAPMSVAVFAQDNSVLEERRAQNEAEYERLTREITLSEERTAQIASDVAAIRKDHATLSAALVQAAKTERKLSDEIAAISERLNILQLQEADLRASLAERRGVLAEVLGALQRMGLNPPPAILVQPEDALSSVRSSILLAAVVPELRGETEVLISDLNELSRLSATIAAEHTRLMSTVEEQVAEQSRLTGLLDEKQKLQAESELALASEQKRAHELAEQAGSLRELIDALESEIEIARLREEEAKAASQPQTKPDTSQNLLVGSLPFSALRKQISLPASGRIEKQFGEADGSGGTLQGDIVATHSAAIVTAPVNGVVLYAGPFRSYGQLLILNAGDGYHIVLAGMGRISVSQGQSVLAGEPVGQMGETRLASAVAFAEESSSPGLYVEFRKEGKPVDPAPWWAERTVGRAGNDT